MLKHKIINKETGIITYGMTPPKATHTPEKIAEISEKQVERLRELELDALILYDVQDEAERVDQERPFPYMETIDPKTYGDQYLSGLNVPQIIYRCAGQYNERQFTEWLRSDTERDRYSVYVGASSSKQAVQLELPHAYRLSREHNANLMFGGVVIPERHMKKRDEHLRVIHKTAQGCAFFVSQATYNVDASKSFLSDYYYHCADNGIEMVPILFNLAPCGSIKTLEFMKWLGISMPAWLENELIYSNDVLDKSIMMSKKIYTELFDFALEKGIPIGCSVESVSTRKVEIEASVELLREVKAMMEQRQQVSLS